MSASVDDTLVCRLAGELWAVFAPWRGPWSGGGATMAYLARRSFRSGAGLRWRHAGRDRDERDENVEALGRLERRGLLTRRVEKTKVIATRLLDAGIERACSLAGAPCWSEGRAVCERLAAIDDDAATMTHLGTRWTAEWALAGTPPHWGQCGNDETGRANRSLLSVLEGRAVPALVRGWLISGADLHGRVWYALTAAGRAALTEAPAEAPSEIEGDKDCALAWREGAHAMQVRLAAAPRSEREIGLLPLPVHGGPNVGGDVGARGDVPTVGGRGGNLAAHLATGGNVGGDETASGRPSAELGRDGLRALSRGNDLAQVRDLRAEVGDLLVKRGEFREDEIADGPAGVQAGRDDVLEAAPGLVPAVGQLSSIASELRRDTVRVDSEPVPLQYPRGWLADGKGSDHCPVVQRSGVVVHLPSPWSPHQSPPSAFRPPPAAATEDSMSAHPVCQHLRSPQ